MPEPRPEVLDFLATRRSRPAKTLGAEGPDRAEIERFLTLAARTPDHGKLTPWRFIVLGREAMARVAAAAGERAETLGLDPAKQAAQFTQGAVIVAVVASPKPSGKIPAWEQELSAGAVCYGLLMAALAAGWGANWLTGALAREPGFLGPALGCQADEFVAGFLHIGTETVTPADRDRPDVAALTAWL